MSYDRLIQKISKEKVSKSSSDFVKPPSAENKTVKIDEELEKTLSSKQELLGEEAESVKNSVVSKSKKIKNISSKMKKNKSRTRKPDHDKIIELW